MNKLVFFFIALGLHLSILIVLRDTTPNSRAGLGGEKSFGQHQQVSLLAFARSSDQETETEEVSSTDPVQAEQVSQKIPTPRPLQLDNTIASIRSESLPTKSSKKKLAKPVAETEQKKTLAHKNDIGKTKSKKDIDSNSELNAASQQLIGDGQLAHKGVNAQGELESAWQTYLSQIRGLINSNKTYPKQARLRRQEGQVDVEFEVTKKGRIKRYTLLRKTHSSHINNSVDQLFSELELPLPDEKIRHLLPVILNIPLFYSLNNNQLQSDFYNASTINTLKENL